MTNISPRVFFCLTLALATSLGSVYCAQAASLPSGSRVEGHFGADWIPCIVVGNQRPTGGYVLRCDALPDPDNVFSETDVRSLGAPAPLVKQVAAAKPTHAVQGHIADRWEDCTMIGTQLPTGGYRLHCPSLPDAENVFSASDVREIGAPAAVVPVPAAMPGRRVQGNVRGTWESCIMSGGQLPTGGYLLRCDSAPNVETVFSASDVRL
jgi:hypothetical protein